MKLKNKICCTRNVLSLVLCFIHIQRLYLVLSRHEKTAEYTIYTVHCDILSCCTYVKMAEFQEKQQTNGCTLHLTQSQTPPVIKMTLGKLLYHITIRFYLKKASVFQFHNYNVRNILLKENMLIPVALTPVMCCNVALLW